jgi:hypothetical protein
VDDAIYKYKTLSDTVFSDSNKSNDPKAAFGNKVLKREIKNVVATAVVRIPPFNERIPELICVTPLLLPRVEPYECEAMGLVMRTHSLHVSGRSRERQPPHRHSSNLSKFKMSSGLSKGIPNLEIMLELMEVYSQRPLLLKYK